MLTANVAELTAYNDSELYELLFPVEYLCGSRRPQEVGAASQ